MDIDEFKSDVDWVFTKLKQLNSHYDANTNNTLPNSDKISGKIFIRLVVAPFIVGVVLAGILYYFDKIQTLGAASLVLISVGYLGIIAFQISLVLENWTDIFGFLKNPLTILLARVQDETKLDYANLYELKEKSSLVLEHVQAHLKSERDSFERRVGVLVGALEKVGIIPGLITLYLAWLKFGSNDISLEPEIATGIFLLYFFAFYCHFLFSRLDRFIYTIDTVIDLKNENK